MLSQDEIRARSLRLSGRPADPRTGTPNDPFQEAQSRYAGPGWQQFFGGLQQSEEDARLAGKNFRVNWSGFGNTEGDMARRPRGPSLAAMGADLNPLEETAQKQFLLQQQANDAIEQAKAEKAGQAQYIDAEAARTNAGLQKSYDDFVLSSTLAPTGAPTTVTRTAGVTPLADAQRGIRMPDTITARPTPGTDPDELLRRTVPANLRLGLEKTLADMALKRQAATLDQAKLNETIRENKAKDAQNAPFVAPIDATGTPVTGPALLQTLPAAKQKLVTAVLEGRQAIPSGTALKDPYWKGVLETANLIDPNFDTVNFNARANTRKDFTSGAASKQINAINTVVGHLHDLADVGGKLGNTPLNWVNAIYNKLTPGGTERGVNLNNFETLKEGVATELMRTWRQVGAGSEKEIEDWKSTLTSAKSPEELKGAFKTVGGMLESKLGALDQQYKQGMGTDKVSAISPESRTRLDDLQGLGAAPAAPAAAKPRNPFRK